MPSLAALLLRAQGLAGRLLSRREVLRIRDASQVVIADARQAAAVTQRRGYPDLDARRAYASYLRDIATAPSSPAGRTRPTTRS